MDLPTLLQQIPPGVDVFDFIAGTLTSQVYPDLGKAFSVQVYLCTALCCVVITTIIAGLFIRWKKGRLQFLVADGPATRPNPKLFVPVLWLLAGICMIVHIFWLRSSLQRHYLPYGLGVLWWLMASPLTCSYAFISASVMCSAPLVRRGLMRLNAGHRSIGLAPAFLVINCTILGMCCLALCPVYVPANLLGSGFIDFNKGFTGLLSLIAKARATGNIGLLANASTYMDNLDQGQRRNRRSTLIGGAIYSSHIVIFFLFGLIPSLFLNGFMRKRIDRLERGLNVTSQQHLDSLEQHLKVPLPMNSRNLQPTFNSDEAETLASLNSHQFGQHVSEIELPQNRPFANLAPISVVPQNYATILQAHVDPQEKAKRLKKALLRDNLQLGAYFLMLSSMGSLAFFQAAKGPWHLDAKQQFLTAYTWELWSYLAPAVILAGAFFYDAITTGHQDEEVDTTLSVFPTHNFLVPPLASIQLSQTVQVVEEHAYEEKKTLYERFDT